MIEAAVNSECDQMFSNTREFKNEAWQLLVVQQGSEVNNMTKFPFPAEHSDRACDGCG